jgi:hypothetical protein
MTIGAGQSLYAVVEDEPDMEGFDVMDKLASIGSRSSILITSGHDSSIVLATNIYGRGIRLNMRGALTQPSTRNDLLSGLGLTE